MNKRLAYALAIACTICPALSSCNDKVLMSVVAGVQDGTMSTTTNLINAFFAGYFPSRTSIAERSGNGSFVQL